MLDCDDHNATVTIFFFADVRCCYTTVAVRRRLLWDNAWHCGKNNESCLLPLEFVL